MKFHVFLYVCFQGCQELVDHFIKNPPSWSAFRSSDYGYMRMKVFNRTHLYLEQVSDNKVKNFNDVFDFFKTFFSSSYTQIITADSSFI